MRAVVDRLDAKTRQALKKHDKELGKRRSENVQLFKILRTTLIFAIEDLRLSLYLTFLLRIDTRAGKLAHRKKVKRHRDDDIFLDRTMINKKVGWHSQNYSRS